MSHPRLYWTADRSALVEESDPRGAFLAYPEADPILPEHLALLGKKAATIIEEPALAAGEVSAEVAPAIKPDRKPTRRR